MPTPTATQPTQPTPEVPSLPDSPLPSGRDSESPLVEDRIRALEAWLDAHGLTVERTVEQGGYRFTVSSRFGCSKEARFMSPLQTEAVLTMLALR